jgi:hypothetical protein
MALYELTKDGVKNTITNQIIPDDNRNKDWKIYQTWLDLGNTPDPQSPVIPTSIDDEWNGQNEWLKAIVQESGINLVALKARVQAGRP